ncbi:MAG TPA: GyrI-like domain-containing protein [Thermoanaerobaculia bacterium]|jgi:effector-binding domain-containing protein
MLDKPEIVQTDTLQAAVIHLTIPRSEIQKAMGPAIGELKAAVAAQGITPAGPIFAHHLKMDTQSFDFELGLPVATPVSATGHVKAGSLKAATVVRAIYHGPYEKLYAAWSEVEAWMKAEGLKGAPDLWESYVSGPESSPDPSTWRTELNRPLVR